MNKALLHPHVQEFIRKNIDSDLTRLVLSGSKFDSITAAELAQQVAGLKIAQKKLPTWFQTPGIVFPPRVNLEQTSSEVTARYKASLVKGNRLLDLTGGFGIDDYFFAENFKEVLHCELNPALSEIAAHNFEVLNRKNIRTIQGDGIEYLKNSSDHFEVIYIDPSRRDDHGGKVFRLGDCLPDVPAHLELLFNKTNTVFLKTSPLLDLKAGIEELKKVKEVHIVAVQNEVKELLWLLEKSHSLDPEIKTFNFTKNGREEFSAFPGDDFNLTYSLPQKYLYEPNAAIMKSGLFAALEQKKSTKKLHPHSHLFTSHQYVDFPGRVFEVLDTHLFKPSVLKKNFKNKKADITTRNFPDTVANLRQLLKIKDGGSTYLFFTTDIQDNRIVLECRKA